MSGTPTTYDGDERLAELLRAAGIASPLGEIKALIAGIAAAPRPLDDGEWLGLVAPAMDDTLRGQFGARYERVAAADDGMEPRAEAA